MKVRIVRSRPAARCKSGFCHHGLRHLSYPRDLVAERTREDTLAKRDGSTSCGIVLALLVASCATQFPIAPTSVAAGPTPREILRRSVEASGGDPFDAHRDIAVRFSGEGGWLVQRLQPELTDGYYRRTSEERLLLREVWSSASAETSIASSRRSTSRIGWSTSGSSGRTRSATS